MIAVTRHLAIPPEVMFDRLTDFARAPERIPAIKRVEVLTPGPVGVGTKFRETRMMFKREATEQMEVVAFDRPKLVELRAISCGAEYRSTFRVAPDGTGTRL